MNDAVKICLTNGEFTIVDSDDFKHLSQFKWNKHNLGYAFRGPKINGKRVSVWLHRVVNKTPEGFETDHINRNKLDNRKSNLRTATVSQNKANIIHDKAGKSSRFRGVTKSGGRWVAQLHDGKASGYLGSFGSETEAAIAYNIAAQSKLGSFAVLNDLKGAE